MRKQIAAANWKMNLDLQQARELLNALLGMNILPGEGQEVVLGVPFPYLLLATDKISNSKGFFTAAQNCSFGEAGAFTGEVSAAMLASCGVTYVIIGHSERREYFNEDSPVLSRKVDVSLAHGLHPIFCCGESLQIRESGEQNEYVESQIREALVHLEPAAVRDMVIAYEPIWAIGTGKTASAEQAQEMHAHIRKVLAEIFGDQTAGNLSVLYGGSVKAANAKEIFGKPDVDGGLIGGASLQAAEFAAIIGSLKK
jgi:triosephosphate isomerase